ncbi:DinB family protein [Streptomyces sp. NPDC088097]|uniref:DinB family protein n=1 Tax=Streptomyces sp. NPDC088097 TaxID=3365823 RepID=UPI003820B6A2
MDSDARDCQAAAARWAPRAPCPALWADPDGVPRETDVERVGERGMLLDGLRRYRLSLTTKCAGLEVGQMARRSVPPSTMSLLGLVRHMAEGERNFRRMAGEDLPRIYRTVEDRDGDWNGAVADPAVVADAWQRWRAESELTDRFIACFPDLGAQSGEMPLRQILVAHISEYARHCGHADLLRERIDGRVCR